MVTNFLLLLLLLLSLVTEIISSRDGHGAAGIGISRDDFPPGFVFGAGTSAYQVPCFFCSSFNFNNYLISIDTVGSGLLVD